MTLSGTQTLFFIIFLVLVWYLFNTMAQIPSYPYYLSLTAVGVVSIFTVKDYMSGGKYRGKERIPGKTVIVTGANTGIGKETALELAKRGAKLILACRDMGRCEKARDEIINESANRNIHCRKLDLASMKSIREFAEKINKEEAHLDILINNAGIMKCPKMLTEEGFEMQLGVNHLGHFLLTNLLLDKLKESAPSRIINVSSLAHLWATVNFDDLNSEKKYDGGAAYGQSKLANILFTKELARKLKGTGVTVNALHPGVVDTELMRHIPLANSSISKFIFFPISYTLFKTPKLGAQTTIHVALDPSIDDITGKYFSDCVEKDVTAEAENEEIARRLWLVSEKWTRLT
ncbi:retinol dehydrogenase 13-like [Patella vulgata]|uniref:retinol dehydrogenase 13-like n=1 Tax=Patella vulgata TaxID=6465 RepID=UPI00217FF965|nr:retinol dehydrogenase 13-like [Patella vulgata]